MWYDESQVCFADATFSLSRSHTYTLCTLCTYIYAHPISHLLSDWHIARLSLTHNPQYLSDIEQHLGESISLVDSTFNVPVIEHDGVVIYGEKRSATGIDNCACLLVLDTILARSGVFIFK